MDAYQDPRDRAEARLGTVLAGRWRLQRLLGVGGAAWVYLAADEEGNLAAIKVLHTPLVDEREVMRRFVREARVANIVGHKGVVRVLDDGLCGRSPFIAMEYLRGETLEERRERKGGRLPVDEVMWAADQLLAILAAAHGKGIVHRDIKPENVFITFDRELKLLDFGIARLRDLIDDEAPLSESEPTRVGLALGTLDFMAPEQARGDWEKVGVQSDLWAVGATMFMLLTGRTVHDEPDNAGQLRAVLTRSAPPIVSIVPTLPDAVGDLIDQALRYDAPGRWHDARQMRVALWVAHRAGDSPPSSEDGAIPRPPLQFGPSAPPVSIDRK